MSVYEDPEGRFTIKYPFDWYVNEEPNLGEDIVVKFDISEPEIVGPVKPFRIFASSQCQMVDTYTWDIICVIL